MIFFLRVFALSLLRMALMVCVWYGLSSATFLGWAMPLVAYGIYFIITFGTATWALHRRGRSGSGPAIVTALFLGLEFGFMFFVASSSLGGTFLDTLRGLWRIETVVIVSLYLFAIMAAADRAYERVRLESSPEGLGT